MADVDRLGELAGALLDVVEAAAATHAVELPSRRFVTAGAVAWDCPLLAVSIVDVARGQPSAPAGSQANRQSDTFAATLEIVLLRMVPAPSEDGTAPTTAKMIASGAQLARDGWLVTVGIAGGVRTLEGCSSVAQTTAMGVGPDGGLGGWRASLLVGL